MTLTEAIAHVRYSQMMHERNAEQCRLISDETGFTYHKMKADAMELILDEVNRLSKELLVAVSRR